MKRQTAVKAGLLALAALAVEGAAKCSHDIAERGLAAHKARRAALESRRLSARGAGYNEASTANLTNPIDECSYYDNPVVDAMYASYPAIWEIASIVNGDTEAWNAYNAIVSQANFPNISTKGTPMGDFTGVQYDPTADPDCWWTESRCVSPKHAGIPADVHTCPEPATWGLTYDDGPNCTHNAFYSYLRQNAYTATMFYIGSNVMDWSYQAQRALADGHEIGIHTWSHRYSTALTNEQFFAELWYTRKAIKAIVGVTPTIWRPPFGDIDDRIRFIAAGMNLTTVIWDNDTFDWEVQDSGNPGGLPTASVQANYGSLLAGAQQGQYSTHGTIVLTHEINGDTMQIAMEELPQVAAAFKHVVPVGTCQNWTQPYLEASFEIPTFAQWVGGNTKISNSSVAASSSSAAPTSTTPVSSASTGSASAGATGTTSKPGNSSATHLAADAAATTSSHASSAALSAVAPLLALFAAAALPASLLLA